jgi:predicted dehydrogenase
MVRVVAGEEPTVEWAQARLMRPGVDKRMRAGLHLPSGAVAELDCELAAQRFPQIDLTIDCAHRTIVVANPVLPQIYHRLTVIEGGRRRSEQLTRTPTYSYQMAAFADALRTGTPTPSDGADGVRNMRVVDALYRAAGMTVRGVDLP